MNLMTFSEKPDRDDYLWNYSKGVPGMLRVVLYSTEGWNLWAI